VTDAGKKLLLTPFVELLTQEAPVQVETVLSGRGPGVMPRGFSFTSDTSASSLRVAGAPYARSRSGAALIRFKADFIGNWHEMNTCERGALRVPL
jgi:hypothetical protein